MKKVLLFGATGNLGKEIAKEAVKQGYELTAVVRNKAKAAELSEITTNFKIANIADPDSIVNICTGFDVVISALGKSVSLNDKSKPSFRDIDLNANSAILNEALKSKVQKFVYVSAFESENYPHLEYFKVHHEFSEKLRASGINYSVIKPPAIFCAFIDMIAMSKKGQLMNIGTGDKTTNPIYEGDLAKVCVDSIKENNVVKGAGGENVYTRKQLNEIIQKAVDPSKKVRSVPAGMLSLFLPVIKIFNKNTYDKMAFFAEVLQHDTLAPKLGKMKFEEYIAMKVKN